MERARDKKMEMLAASAACRGLPRRTIRALSRLGDLVELPPGTVVQRGDRTEPWSYLVLEGTLMVRDTDGVCIVGEGGWLTGHRSGEPVSAVTADVVVALVFSPVVALAAHEILEGAHDESRLSAG